MGIKLIKRNRTDKRKATPKRFLKATFRLMVNPNILALIIGFLFSVFGGAIPGVVDEYLVYLGNISTPMAMIFIGSSLAGYSFKDILKSHIIIEASAVKLILLPLITVGIVYFLPIAPIIKVTLVLGCCFPVAATAAMLSEQEGQDPAPASKTLFLSTMASLVTVPAAINLLDMAVHVIAGFGR